MTLKLWRSPRARRAALALLVVVMLLAAWVVLTPFDRVLLKPEHFASTRLVDRAGRPLREVLNVKQGRARWLTLDHMSPELVLAVIHAEDVRFREHRGLDLTAIGRSAWLNLRRGRVVAGGSTITQQTVKLATGRRGRTLSAKAREAILAIRLERTLDKDAILTQYLNRAPFGNQLFGVEAASWMYFDKPARHLTLAEAAFLAVIPRATTAYDPYRHRARVLRAQKHLLNLMRERGAITAAAHLRAINQPVRLFPRQGRVLAPHFTEEALRRLGAHDGGEVSTTLDLELQRDVQGIVDQGLERLHGHSATQAAAVVLDTRTGEVLAWVGSREYWDAKRGGANDGVIALRQPGSTLKPFVYGALLERGGRTTDIFADLPVQFATPRGAYIPKNYSERFYGPVTIRDALGSSLNIPAVLAAERASVPATLKRLRELGFSTLTRDAEHYGLGISLGNGEVRLLDLAAAYATLGRLGQHIPPRLLQQRQPAEPRTVFDARTAYVLMDMLSDDTARERGFGLGSVLAFPYRVAIKTGTSTDARDSWTVAVTPEHTVAVWVGNFDGKPMRDVSGSTGAAPIARHIIQNLYPRAVDPSDVPWVRRPAGLTTQTICPMSGRIAGPSCPHRRVELVRTDRLHTPRQHDPTIDPEHEHEHQPDSGADEDAPTCHIHVALKIDRRNGLLATPSCPAEVVTREQFHRLPGAWIDWAEQQDLAIAPTQTSPLCDGAASQEAHEPELAILHPVPGDVFILEPDARPGEQAIAFRASVDAETQRRTLWWFLDGRRWRRASAPYRQLWNPTPGTHTLGIGITAPESTVTFEVR